MGRNGRIISSGVRLHILSFLPFPSPPLYHSLNIANKQTKTKHQKRGIFFFVGPVTMILALVFEWILGNFFSMMVMGLFAVFWLSFGLLEVPNLALGLPFATPEDPTGTLSREYNAAIGIYLLVWGFAFFTFFVFTTRINTVLATIFSLTAVATWILAGAYFKSSWGDYAAAAVLQKVCLIFLSISLSLSSRFTRKNN